MDRLGLAAKGIKPLFVKISRCKIRVKAGRPAPRAIIEAFARNVDIIAVQHAMDEACRHKASGHACGLTHHMADKACGGIWPIFLTIILAKGIGR